MRVFMDCLLQSSRDSEAATARPISAPESYWMKYRPGTMTSLWFSQLRQSLRLPMNAA
jgi:hypothetical protein